MFRNAFAALALLLATAFAAIAPAAQAANLSPTPRSPASNVAQVNDTWGFYIRGGPEGAVINWNIPKDLAPLNQAGGVMAGISGELGYQFGNGVFAFIGGRYLGGNVATKVTDAIGDRYTGKAESLMQARLGLGYAVTSGAWSYRASVAGTVGQLSSKFSYTENAVGTVDRYSAKPTVIGGELALGVDYRWANGWKAGLDLTGGLAKVSGFTLRDAGGAWKVKSSDLATVSGRLSISRTF